MNPTPPVAMPTPITARLPTTHKPTSMRLTDIAVEPNPREDFGLASAAADFIFSFCSICMLKKAAALACFSIVSALADSTAFLSHSVRHLLSSAYASIVACTCSALFFFACSSRYDFIIISS